MRKITRQDIVDFIHANPDRVNPKVGKGFYKYRYFTEDGNPSCVFGNLVFSVAGKEAKGTLQECFVIGFRDNKHVFDSDDTANFANEIQTHTDVGDTWGWALQKVLDKEAARL